MDRAEVIEELRGWVRFVADRSTGPHTEKASRMIAALTEAIRLLEEEDTDDGH